MSGRFDGVVGVLLDQRLDFRDHIIVHGRPGRIDAVHHLGAGREVDSRQGGLDEGGVDVVGDVGCCYSQFWIFRQCDNNFYVLTASGTPHGDGYTLLLGGVTDEALVAC